MSSTGSSPVVLTYKTIEGHSLLLDLFLPNSEKQPTNGFPALVYFHGGGLTVGTRRSWFPTWLYDRCIASGCAFISADHRLLPTCTGHDILEDIRDLFAFLRSGVNTSLSEKSVNAEINGQLLATGGTSSGGLCAYLAGIHVEPRPKSILALYAMGGDIITPRYIEPKQSSFFRGREVLDPADFREFLHPISSREIVTGSERAYHPPESPTPGFPANTRMFVTRLYMQLGTFLDYYTGQHEPSLSQVLRASDNRTIPEEHIPLFPQLLVDAKFPPTCFIHGASDTAVLVEESYNMQSLLEKVGVKTEMHAVEGQEHSFDYAEGAYEKFQSLFDTAWAFALNALGA